MKNCPQQPFGLLMLNKMPNKPWKNISMDLIVQVKSYNSICVIIDRLIKGSILYSHWYLVFIWRYSTTIK